MIIKSIEIAAESLVRGAKVSFQGVVSLICEDGARHFTCEVPVTANANLSELRDRLVREAMRQVGRMPEFRNRQPDLSLAA